MVCPTVAKLSREAPSLAGKSISALKCPFMNLAGRTALNLPKEEWSQVQGMCPYLRSAQGMEKPACADEASCDSKKITELCPPCKAMIREDGAASGASSAAPKPVMKEERAVVADSSSAAAPQLDYGKLFHNSIQKVQHEGRYRVFNTIERQVGRFPVAMRHNEGKRDEVKVWCSNDYLGMGHHPAVVQGVKDAADRHGAGAGGTRNISGTTHLVKELEGELADLHHAEAALVFTSGYVANDTTLATLARVMPNCVVYSDTMNHASMIEGIRHGGNEKHIFRHNDIRHLEDLLKKSDPSRPKLIALESVYSMSGSISPLKHVCDLAKQYNALVFLDEVHAVGLYGPRGGGVAEREGLLESVDIFSGTLAKAYGVLGGYIAAKKDVVDAVRCHGSGFIFSTALPPPVLGGALASVKHLKASNVERTVQRARVALLKKSLSEAGLPHLPNPSHIVPVMVGDAVLCKRASDVLLDKHGIYVQPINYPTVPKGTERLRLTVTPWHSEEDVKHLTGALTDVWRELDLSVVSRTALDKELQNEHAIQQSIALFEAEHARGHDEVTTGVHVEHSGDVSGHRTLEAEKQLVL